MCFVKIESILGLVVTFIVLVSLKNSQPWCLAETNPTNQYFKAIILQLKKETNKKNQPANFLPEYW